MLTFIHTLLNDKIIGVDAFIESDVKLSILKILVPQQYSSMPTDRVDDIGMSSGKRVRSNSSDSDDSEIARSRAIKLGLESSNVSHEGFMKLFGPRRNTTNVRSEPYETSSPDRPEVEEVPVQEVPVPAEVSPPPPSTPEPTVDNVDAPLIPIPVNDNSDSGSGSGSSKSAKNRLPKAARKRAARQKLSSDQKDQNE